MKKPVSLLILGISIFVVGLFEIVKAQTRVLSVQTNPIVQQLVNGLGTAIQTNGNGTGQLNTVRLVRQVVAADTIYTSDCHGLVLTNGFNLNLPVPSAVPGFSNGCEVIIKNNSATTATTLSGGLSQTVAANAACMIDTDGTSWYPEIC